MVVPSLDRSGSQSFSIPDIVGYAESGRLRVPTFQRQFVWKGPDVRDLFDSLYRGFPVGTLLLWKKPAPEAEIELGPIQLRVPARDDALWVVDGQQRVTSLFAALTRENLVDDHRFQVAFDLATQKFVSMRPGVDSSRFLPVRAASDTRSLQQWTRAHIEELSPEDLDLADNLIGQLRDYRIPAYIIEEQDQTLLREVFDRVNSAGKPISRAQIFQALFGERGSVASPQSVLRDLRHLNFGDLEENRVVQSILAMRGGDVQRDMHEEFRSGENPEEWFEHARDALERAITFLRADGIVHSRLMPNTLPIPVLAAFFHLHPDPEPWILRLVSRWLWRGWVHGFGREGGQTPVLRRAVRSVNPEFGDPGAAPDAYEAVKSLLAYVPDREADNIPLSGFNAKYANPRLILLALASRVPLTGSGEPLDIAERFEEFGAGAVSSFVPGLNSRAETRSFWPGSASDLVNVSDKVLASHLLARSSVDRLLSGDIDAFIDERGEWLRQVVAAFLGSRMEPGLPVRRSIGSLVAIALEGADHDADS